jgi:formate hydrogenlyase subunit 3/multisubunit Na+/H+ antiporter MnhD subunit
MVLFSALVLLAGQAGGTDFARLQTIAPPQLAVALLILGFGIKLALPGLHLWLPLSYAAAPAAGAAVLSGPMISAGFLGWLRFLPPGHEALAPWGKLLMVLGLVGVVYGALIGLLQVKPRLVLGYSSISKMGLLSAGFGIALIHPENAPWLVSALVFFTLHHLLVKSALFLGVDLRQQGQANAWVLVGLVLLGLALIGAPLTSGALAKAQLSDALPTAFSWFTAWLSLAGLITSLLMGRLAFLLCKPRRTPHTAGRLALSAWVLLTGVILALPFLIADVDVLFSGVLPVVVGLLMSGWVWFHRSLKLTRLLGLIPPGDGLIPLRKILRSLLQAINLPLKLMDTPPGWGLLQRVSGYVGYTSLLEASATSQSGLGKWAGPLWLGLTGLVLLLLTFGF